MFKIRAENRCKKTFELQNNQPFQFMSENQNQIEDN